MVGDAENESPASSLDHGDRGVATEWLTSDDPDGTAGRSGTPAADATRQASGHQEQTDNDADREDQS